MCHHPRMSTHRPGSRVAVLLLALPALAVTSLLGGCGGGPARNPLPDLAARASDYTQSTPMLSADELAQPWWQRALDAGVQAQIEHALSSNVRLQGAAQEVRRLRGRLDEAEGRRWGDLRIAGQASLATRNPGSHGPGFAGDLDLVLPLDLFGRLRASRNAASFELAAGLADYEQLRQTQIVDYLLAYIDAAEAVQREHLVKRQLNLSETHNHLVEVRFAQGQASRVDVLQQRDQVAALRQQLPTIRADGRNAANRLAVLTGLPPRVVTAPDAGPELPTIATHFAFTTPADLVRTRPDLLALRARLAAQDSQYEAALADRLPSLSLALSQTLRAAAGDPRALLAGLLILDNGTRQAIAEQHAAAAEQTALDYLQTWLEALTEVDQLLTLEKTLGERLQLADQRLAVAAQLLDATQRRYESGISDYLPVLVALRSLQQQQRDRLSLAAESMRTRVRLHRALGLPAQAPSEDPS